jgi:hypothetical protein
MITHKREQQSMDKFLRCSGGLYQGIELLKILKKLLENFFLFEIF